MTFIPRVQPSATLATAHGSASFRRKQARELCSDFRNWIRDIAGAKLAKGEEQLSREEVNDYFVQKYPGVNITSKPNDSKWGGYVSKKFEQKASSPISVVSGYDFVVKALDKPKNLKSPMIVPLMHEHYHLVDFILNPKIAAKESEVIDGVGDARSQVSDNFYLNKIYQTHEPNDFYDDCNKTPLQRLKDNITGFFGCYDFSTKNRVLVLQHWRYLLGSEIGAYREGVNTLIVNSLRSKGENIETKNNQERHALFKKHEAVIKEKFPELFDFEKEKYIQKYKLLCRMLRDHISMHRKINSALRSGIISEKESQPLPGKILDTKKLLQLISNRKSEKA